MATVQGEHGGEARHRIHGVERPLSVFFARRAITISRFELRARARADAAVPVLPVLKWTLPNATATERAVGAIDGFASKGYTTNVQVASSDDQAKWKLEVSTAAPQNAPTAAAFQKDVDDILVVCY